MVSNKYFNNVSGNTKSFLSDFVIKNEQYCNVYNYIYDADGVEGSVVDGLYVRTANEPQAEDAMTLDKWALINNNISFYTAHTPPAGSTVVVEVASTPEELSTILAGPAVQQSEDARDLAIAAQTAAETAQAAAETAQTAAETAETNASTEVTTFTTVTVPNATAQINTVRSEAETAIDTKVAQANTDVQAIVDAAEASVDTQVQAVVDTATADIQQAKTDAQTAATNASSSATSASTSATNASTSETNAAASATAASTSATTATTQATNASSSATSAANNAANASASATAAAGSATAASTSETNASNSATAAATSETNAATSATEAATSEANAAASAAEAAGYAVSGIDNSIEYTATEGQTEFAINYDVGSINVHLNGVLLTADDYTATNGTSVVLEAGATVGDIVHLQAFGLFDVADTYSQLQVDTMVSDKQTLAQVQATALCF